MGLMDVIRADARRFLTDGNGFGVPVLFTTPDGLTTAVLNCRVTKHHLGIDREGTAVSAKQANIAVSDAALAALAYPVRNGAGEVALIKHKVTWTDSSGTLWTYVIRETYPDETIGLVVCILGDFK